MEIGIDVSPLQKGHGPSGIGSYARGLLAGLRQLETSDRFLLYYWKDRPLGVDQGMLPQNSILIGIPLPRAGRGSALLAQQLTMIPYLMAHRPHVYHQLGLVPDPSAGGLPWSIHSRGIVTIHDVTPLIFKDAFFRGKRLRYLIYRLSLAGLGFVRHVLTDSEASRKDLTSLLSLPSEKITVAPLAIPLALTNAFEQERRTRRFTSLTKKYLLTVAGDYPNKDLNTLVRAYAQVAASVGELDLVVVGPPSAPPWLSGLLSAAVISRVHFFRDVDDGDLAYLYRNALAVIVPSMHEGFGLPVLEAMGAGAPVIASDAAALLEVAGDAAVFFRRGDAANLADAIRLVAADSDTRQKIRQAGFERAQGFSWKRTAELTYRAYRPSAGVTP